MLHAMDYREQAPPAGLALSVRALWTLDCGGAAVEAIEHQAVPDGCIELIWRTHGTSSWDGAQPQSSVQSARTDSASPAGGACSR